MNATLVSREERVAAPHGSRAIRNAIVQVKQPVCQRRIVGNLKGNRSPEARCNTNSECAIAAYDVVLGRDKAAVDVHASIKVPDNLVLT